MSTLISAAQVEAAKAQLRIDHLENASIRQLVMLINQLESDSGAILCPNGLAFLDWHRPNVPLKPRKRYWTASRLRNTQP